MAGTANCVPIQIKNLRLNASLSLGQQAMIISIMPISRHAASGYTDHISFVFRPKVLFRSSSTSTIKPPVAMSVPKGPGF